MLSALNNGVVSLRIRIKTCLLLVSLLLSSCVSPSQPKEMLLAEAQQKMLVTYHVPEYASAEYSEYAQSLAVARQRFESEWQLLRWISNDKNTRTYYRTIYEQGKAISKIAELRKSELADSIRKNVKMYESQIQTLNRITLKIDLGKPARKHLVKAELALQQAIDLFNDGKLKLSRYELEKVKSLIETAEDELNQILSRYHDSQQQQKWQMDVKQAIALSKISGGTSLVVDKIRGVLYLYRNGSLVKSYQVSIGSNGLQNKVRAGDKATPEGNYRITHKLFSNRFYKALVIDYPNSDDIRQFKQKVNRGQLPASAGIGGYIEIHGGGKNSLTDGCIGLDNHDIDELFRLVEIGTTVTIVGSMSDENISYY